MSLSHDIEQVAKAVEKSAPEGLNLGRISGIFSENLSNVFNKVSDGALKALAEFPDSDQLLGDLLGAQAQTENANRAPEVALVSRPVEGLTDSDRIAVENITQKIESDNSELQVRRNVETQLQQCSGADRQRVIQQLERETNNHRSTSPWVVTADPSAQNGYSVARRRAAT